MGDNFSTDDLWNNLDNDSKKIITDVLKEKHIVEFDITLNNINGGQNFMGKLLTILAKSKVNPKAELKLILKQIPEEKKLRDSLPVEEIFRHEIFMYTDILPSFDKLQDIIPDEYKFKYAECFKTLKNGNMTILMEDLSADGYSISEHFPMDIDHVELVLTNLARFHALSFAMKERNTSKFKDLVHDLGQFVYPENFISYIDLTGELTSELIEDPVKRSKLMQHTNKLFEKFQKYRSSERTEPYNVICHADCWKSNLLFKYKAGKPNDLRIIDWQGSTYASPITDVAHFLFCSTDSAFRRKCYPYILDVYYNELKSQLARLEVNINNCYPKTVFLKHINEILTYGLTMSMIATPFHTASFQDDKGSGHYDVLGSKKKFNPECKRRILEVIDDFIAFKLI